MIKIISFDIDKTLITGDFDKNVWMQDLPKFYAEQNNISFEEAKEFVYNKYQEHKGNNKWTSLPFWFEMFGLKNWKKLLSQNLDKIQLNEGALEVLEELHKKYKLIIITQNPKEFFDEKLKNIHHYFDKVFSSTYHYNQLNKDTKVYEDIVKQLGVKSEEILHVGDDVKFDYQVPSSIGIKTVLIDEKNKFSELNTISNLNELLNKI